MEVDPKQLLVQIASYNTNLQGLLGLPQDLVDWLSPTLQISTFLSPIHRAPDIIAVGFQELLPLHLGRAFIFRCYTPWGLRINSNWALKSCNRQPQRAYPFAN